MERMMDNAYKVLTELINTDMFVNFSILYFLREIKLKWPVATAFALATGFLIAQLPFR